MIHFLSWKILRKYGVPKPKFDKSKYNKAGKEQHPVKVVSTKRPVTKPPTKEKSMLNSVRWVSSASWHLWNIGFHCRNPGVYPPSFCVSMFWMREMRARCYCQNISDFWKLFGKVFFFPQIGVELGSIYRTLESCSLMLYPQCTYSKK